MQLLRIAVLATVIAVSLAFPMPQDSVKAEIAPVVEQNPVPVVAAGPTKKVTEQKDEEVLETEKIVINVEVKAVPTTSKIPATLEITEIHEQKEKPIETVKVADIKAEPVIAAVVPKTAVYVVKKAESDPEVEKSTPVIVDQTVDASSVIDASVPKKVAIVSQPVETKPEEKQEEKVVPVVTDTAGDDSKISDESTSRQEDSAIPEKPIESVPVLTFAKAVEESLKSDQVINQDTEVKEELRSATDEKIVPIVEELPKEYTKVEAEPAYKTIPVAVVEDEPKIEEAIIKTVEQPEPAKTIVEEPKVIEENKETKSVVKANEPEPVELKDIDSVKQTPVVKSTEQQTEKLADNPAKLDIVLSESAVDKRDSVKSDKEEPKVFIVEAKPEVKVEDVSKVEQNVAPVVVVKAAPIAAVATVEKIPDTQKLSEPIVENPVTETKVKAEPAEQVDGSSIKASTKSEVPTKQVEDKSDGDSSAAKSSEEVKKLTVEQEKIIETPTAETTPVPVKPESKSKGKKKLPGSNKKQNTI
ncbi:titin-like isoform X2 [Malaya genurostris]|uniref:titin-like isoform X2 n=1 Tax=Malaya genurostris TaxID=325434 RepID=UPI0026F3C9C4|nr:titin-like isoform X2 [Malaya genurostris]